MKHPLTNLTTEQLNNLIEEATSIVLERDRAIAKSAIENMRDSALSIEELHAHVPVLTGYSNWKEVSDSLNTILDFYF